MTAGNDIGIARWPIREGASVPRVVVVQKEDLDEVRYFVEEGELKGIQELYYVVPEAKSYLPALQYWLKYTRYGDLPVSCEDSDVSRFFLRWEAICAAPFAVSARELKVMVEEAPLAVRAAIPSLENISDCLLLAYVKIAQAFLCAEGAYCDFRPSIDTRSWWRRQPSQAARVASNLEQLAGFSSRSAGLQPIVDSAIEIGDFVSRLGRGNIREALDAAAACCLKAGEIQLVGGQSASTVLFFHRALDFFLQARCFDNGLLIETGDGLEFASSGRDKQVGILSCYSALVDNQIYVRKRHLRDAIWACNEIRNNLILTHSVYGASVPFVVRYRTAIRDAIQEIDGAAARSVLGRTVGSTQGYHLNPGIIFALEEDLGACVVKCALA